MTGLDVGEVRELKPLRHARCVAGAISVCSEGLMLALAFAMIRLGLESQADVLNGVLPLMVIVAAAGSAAMYPLLLQLWEPKGGDALHRARG